MKPFTPFAHQVFCFCAWCVLLAVLVALVYITPAGAFSQDPDSAQTLERVRQLQWVAQNGDVAPDPVQEVNALYCPDPRDWSVKLNIEADPSLKPIAEAKRRADQSLVILINTERLTKYQAATGLFWLMHECMHHVDGDTLRAQDDANRATIEQNTDCKAIKVLVKGHAPLLGRANFATIIDEVTPLNGGTFYKPGPERAADIVWCAAAELSCGGGTLDEAQACVERRLP